MRIVVLLCGQMLAGEKSANTKRVYKEIVPRVPTDPMETRSLRKK